MYIPVIPSVRRIIPEKKDTVIIIPARYGSTRLAAKALLPIAGVSLVEQVWRRASLVKEADIYVATDHDEIADTVRGFGGRVIRTSASCPTGSDRVAEAALALPQQYQNIINVQGDLPFISAQEIPLVLQPLQQGFDVGTLVACMPEEKQKNPSFVKAVVSANSHTDTLRCHWFCRASMPYGHHHLGVYSYSRKALEHFAKTPQHPLERLESLEQIRFLTLGYQIGAMLVSTLALEVNTEEDLEVARAHIES